MKKRRKNPGRGPRQYRGLFPGVNFDSERYGGHEITRNHFTNEMAITYQGNIVAILPPAQARWPIARKLIDNANAAAKL